MAENSLGDYFITDIDEDASADAGDDVAAAISAIPVPSAPFVTSDTEVAEEEPEEAPEPPEPEDVSLSTPDAVAYAHEDEPAATAVPPAIVDVAPTPVAPTAGETRERRLADALGRLMDESPDIQAAALVSLDGFTMASALPEGMQEDRVGAMSAAILGLGERAAIELGRGTLSQVFIQGEGGYVLLMAAGTRSVLTCLAEENAKLGLLLYDMRGAAQEVGEILG